MASNFYRYLPINEKDSLWQVCCTTLGNRAISPGTQYPPEIGSHPREYQPVGSDGRVLHEFQIVYITEGFGSYRNKARTFPIIPGTMFFVIPDVWHWYTCDISTGWHEHWVGFKGPYPNHLLHSGIINSEHPVLNVGVHSELIHLFQDVFDIGLRQPPGFQSKLAGSVIKLIATAFSFEQQITQGSDVEKLVQEYRAIIDDRIYENIDMNAIVQALGVSYSRMRKVFKEYTGHSPHQYYLEMKINKAKELLLTKNSTIKQVAIDLSFENQYYFSRLFKKKTGLSPSQWKSTFR
ncbi:MAG: hypothetical protein DRP70_05515 [Spirochaetes bacterium]|nr:MAG: hypothetical protein DRP70_05515 [Spirochaetota bacterium]RKX92720.1 MAG: hypothetical protein DRZ90_13555 [Spirochaetota bacterium]